MLLGMLVTGANFLLRIVDAIPEGSSAVKSRCDAATIPRNRSALTVSARRER